MRKKKIEEEKPVVIETEEEIKNWESI